MGNSPRLNSTRSVKSSRVRGNSSKGDRAGLGYPIYFPHLAKQEVIDEISMVKSMTLKLFGAYLGELFPYIPVMAFKAGRAWGPGLATDSVPRIATFPVSWCSTEG